MDSKYDHTTKVAEVEAKEVALEERVSSNQTLLMSHVKIICKVILPKSKP